MSDFTKGYIKFALCILALVVVSAWAENHDRDMAKSSDRFEICTVHNFHMTPSEFIGKYGVDKECK